jgi:hypothetical protein
VLVAENAADEPAADDADDDDDDADDDDRRRTLSMLPVRSWRPRLLMLLLRSPLLLLLGVQCGPMYGVVTIVLLLLAGLPRVDNNVKGAQTQTIRDRT